MSSLISFWLTYVAVGAMLVLLAWLGGRRRRVDVKQIAAGRTPVGCGSCGYDVRGLPGVVCPECGSDLDLVGRLSPTFHRWQSVPVTARLIVWTITVLAVGAGTMVVALERALPWRQELKITSEWNVKGGTFKGGRLSEEPAYGLRVQVEVWLTRRAWPSEGSLSQYGGTVPPLSGARWINATITSHFYADPQLRSDGVGEAYTAYARRGDGKVYMVPNGTDGTGDPPPAAAGPIGLMFNEDGLEAALTQAIRQTGYDGPDGTPAEMAGKLQAVVATVLDFGTTNPHREAAPWQGQGSRTAGPSAMMPEALPLVLASGFWLLVWAAGLPFILRRRSLRVSNDAPTHGPLADDAITPNAPATISA